MTSSELGSVQEQTQTSRSFKWSKFETHESQQVRDEWRRWLLEKYFGGDETGPRLFLGDGRLRVLDAGCGVGNFASLLFGEVPSKLDFIGPYISESVTQARRNFEEHGVPGSFVQANIQDFSWS